MITKRFVWLFVCLICLLTAFLGQAESQVIIGFEGVAPPDWYLYPATPYTESGFTLKSSLDAATIILSATYYPVDWLSNGTNIFGWDCLYYGMITLTLTENSGTPFSIQSLEASNAFVNYFDPGMALNVVGHLQGGGTVSQTFSIIQNTFTTFYFNSSFVNLSSLDISANRFPTALLAMDNLAVTPVPEPSALLLLISGLLGIGIIGRVRRKRN